MEKHKTVDTYLEIKSTDDISQEELRKAAGKQQENSKCDQDEPAKLSSDWSLISSDYLVEGLIGQGSFGSVVKAISKSTKDMVAIKMMKVSD